jgi:hypothetical protein
MFVVVLNEENSLFSGRPATFPLLVWLPPEPYSKGMSNERKKHWDRYTVSGNVEAEYVDAEQTVLVNKKGITDLGALQVAEEEAFAAAYETLLGEVRTDTPMTCDLLRHVHERVFGDLYEWAGRWRTAWLSKPGITWPAPDYLDQNMQEFERRVLARYPAHTLQDDAAFCAECRIVLQGVGGISGQHPPLELLHILIQVVRRWPSDPGLAEPRGPPSTCPLVKVAENPFVDMT